MQMLIFGVIYLVVHGITAIHFACLHQTIHIFKIVNFFVLKHHLEKSIYLSILIFIIKEK